MKNLRKNIEKWFDSLDERWEALPIKKQHKYTLYFFTGYLLLTTAVIFKVWLDTVRSDNNMVIEHIENPVIEKKESPAVLHDTLKTILKNKIYERK